MGSFVKRTAWSVLLAVTLLGVAGAPAQAQFGVSAGANFDSVKDIKAGPEDSGTLENATGYHIGVVYDLGLGPLSIRSGLLYRKVGSYDFSDIQNVDDDEVDVTAFEVPVDLRVTILPVPLVSPYVLGGPNLFFPRSGNAEFDDGLEEVSFTFNVGVGADVSVPGVGLTLQPELRYEFGATDYVDDFSIGGKDFNPTDRKISAFALRLNVLF